MPRTGELGGKRERRTALAAGLEHKGFELVQHAFAPQGGGRIEDAMRRVTAAPPDFGELGLSSRGLIFRGGVLIF